MLRETLKDWTVIAGAGISMGRPSCLPDGTALAGMAFDLLVETGEVLIPAPELASLRSAVIEQFRLETFLEILAGEIPTETVFEPFAILRPAVPNFMHLALTALSPRAMVTTNQDLLLEAAQRLLPRPAGRSADAGILHLHGRCDDIASIITVISQYLGGLDSTIRMRFINAVAGAKVVVLGYSGRDRDVMPVLLDAQPAFVRWIFHTPPGVSRRAVLDGMSPELAHAQKVLGPRLEICCTDTRAWVEDQLSDAQRSRISPIIDRLSPAALAIPPEVRAAFETIGTLSRNHALAQLFEQIGEYRAALRVYEALLTKLGSAPPALLLHLGRATTRVHGHEAGRRIFRSILEQRNVPRGILAHAHLNNIDALRNTARPVEAMQQLQFLKRTLTKLPPGREYWQLQGWMLIAHAGIDRLEGRASTAWSQYQRAQEAFLRARDIDGVIDAGTWKAESALMLGRFREAQAIIEEAIRDAAAYGKSLVKAWAPYVKGECLVLSGNCEEGLALANHARATFERSGNIQGPLWSLLLASDSLRGICWRKAVPVLCDLSSRAAVRRLPHVKVRMALEKAELARAAGNWGRTRQELATARSLLRDRAAFTRRPRLVLAHTLLVEAELARSQGLPSAIRLLRRARTAYRQLGAEAFVVRAELGLLMAGSREARIARLRATCVRKGYGLWVPRRTHKQYYPVHFV